MKLVILLCLVAAAYAQQQRYSRQGGPESEAQILRYDNDYGFGNYRWAFQTSNDISHEQQGEVRNQGRDDESLAVKGKYSWVGPDGVTYTITYTADENGYQPEIEQGPGGGIPPGVAASLLG